MNNITKNIALLFMCCPIAVFGATTASIDYVRATAYGVDIYGNTDSAAALQAAADAAQLGNRMLVIPGGTVRINSAVTIRSSLTCNGTRILLGGATAQIILSAEAITMSGCRITPASGVTTTVAAVRTQNYYGFVRIQDLFIFNNGANTFVTGVEVNSGLSSIIENVRVSGASSYGIKLTGGFGTEPNAWTIFRCSLRNSGVADVFIENAASGNIYDTTMEGTTPLHLHVKDANNINVYSPHIESDNSGTVGIKFENTETSSVFGGYYGVLAGGTNVQLVSASRTGIYHMPYANSPTGISIDAGSNGTTISGGYIVSSKVSDSGTNTRWYTYEGIKAGTKTDPGLPFLNDPDTGIYSYGADKFGVTVGGNDAFSVEPNITWVYKGTGIANGARLKIQDAGTAGTARVHTITSGGDWSFGASEAGGATYTVTAPSGNVQQEINYSIADTETALLLRRDLGGTESVVRVTQGAADSCGAGFRCLRVPN